MYGNQPIKTIWNANSVTHRLKRNMSGNPKVGFLSFLTRRRQISGMLHVSNQTWWRMTFFLSELCLPDNTDDVTYHFTLAFVRSHTYTSIECFLNTDWPCLRYAILSSAPSKRAATHSMRPCLTRDTISLCWDPRGHWYQSILHQHVQTAVAG